MKKFFFTLVAATMIATTAFAQKYLLKYNLEKGKSYVLKSDGNAKIKMSAMGQNFDMNQKITLETTLKASAISKNDMTVSLTSKRMIIDISLPFGDGTQKFDTNNPNTSKESAEIKKMMGRSSKAKVKFNGAVIGNVDNSEYKGTMCEKMAGSTIMPFVYPEKPIAVGESWTAGGNFTSGIQQVQEGDMNYTFTLLSYDKGKKIYTIGASGKMSMKSNGIPFAITLKGTFYIDAQTGLPLRSSKLSFSGDASVTKGGQNVKMDMVGTANYGWVKE